MLAVSLRVIKAKQPIWKDSDKTSAKPQNGRFTRKISQNILFFQLNIFSAIKEILYCEIPVWMAVILNRYLKTNKNMKITVKLKP